MKRRLKKFKNHIYTGGEYRKPYYKKWIFRKEKKSELWFSFEYELDEIWNQALPQIKRRDKEAKHIIVDEVCNVFYCSNWDIITL